MKLRNKIGSKIPITNDQGNRTTPSYVGFSRDNLDERVVGDAAKN